MKLFNKKEEKNKVGRPKLADTITKKKAIISISIAIIMIVALLLTAAFKLDIIKFNKLSGTVLCTEIPLTYRTYDAETNPNGIEHGFNDLNLYNGLLESFASSRNLTVNSCEGFPFSDQRWNSVQLSGRNINDASGIENLGLIEFLDLSNNSISEIYLGAPFLRSINLSNNNLTKIHLPQDNRLHNLNLSNNKLQNIDISIDNLELQELVLENNNFSSINLNNNPELMSLYLGNNSIREINLQSNSKLMLINLYNNKIEKIDLSNNFTGEEPGFLNLQNNPISSTRYVLKGETFDYTNLIKLGDSINVSYELDNNAGIVENNIFTALNEGDVTVRMSSDKIFGLNSDVLKRCVLDNDTEYCENLSLDDLSLNYFFENKIKVYGVTSKEYEVENNSKIIDLKNKPLDIDKIVLTEGYTKEINDNVLTIKDGNILVDTYKIVNVKEETSVETTKPVTTTNKTTTQENKTTTTKKVTTKKTSGKTTTKKVTTTTTKQNIPKEDLIVYGKSIPSTVVEQIKGQDINLTLTNKDVSIIINGKDIEEVKDINIDYKLVKYEEDKNIENAFILEFVNKRNLPKKLKVLIKVNEEFKEVVGLKNINIYNYSNDKLEFVEEKLNVIDDEISFYTNKLDKYILMTEKVEKEKQENKKYNINIWIIILLLLLLIIIGYMIYKKNKNSEGA